MQMDLRVSRSIGGMEVPVKRLQVSVEVPLSIGADRAAHDERRSTLSSSSYPIQRLTSLSVRRTSVIDLYSLNCAQRSSFSSRAQHAYGRTQPSDEDRLPDTPADGVSFLAGELLA